MIDNVRRIDKDSPRSNNRQTRIGLYIELKNYQMNLDYTGLDIGVLLNEVLTENGLNTVKKSRSQIPIVVQSFDLPALFKYETLSDLPLVYLM